MALFLTLLLLSCVTAVSVGGGYPRFLANGTLLQHLALHPDHSVGTVYVGAKDRLFQLAGAGLALQGEVQTGPVWDSKECLPPVTVETCPQARRVSNHNMLLLVDLYSPQLITCGSAHQGTCQTRSLASIGHVLYSAPRPLDTQYVAASDPEASTVGLVVRPTPEVPPLMYVGRGYTGSQPPISTRQLGAEHVFSYEETAKLAVASRLSEYDHHFVEAFAQQGHVYFLFYRRDLKVASRQYRTYAGRICQDDQSYYSYVEVPLTCHSNTSGRSYGILQAARMGGTEGQDQLLLGVFTSTVGGVSNPSQESALCVFPLNELDRHMDATRDLCYTHEGLQDGHRLAYIAYDVKSSCANLPTNTLKAYPCGSDHTPSPMASREPLEAEVLLVSPSARLSAVAVSVREGHTIAFLGDSEGNLHKVFLGPDGEVRRYSIIPIQPGSAINSDLLLDTNHTHLYIMTSNAVERRPVEECVRHTDCGSCLAARDPYCGWCVLEGRCGVRSSCAAGSVRGGWLWSFDEQQRCLSVQALSQSNISLAQQGNIVLEVPGLPSVAEEEGYSCFFQETESPASIQGTTVSCPVPEARNLLPVPQGEDSMPVALTLRYQNVTVAKHQFTFYDCSLVQQLSSSAPCRGCVSSRWRCNWCIHQHSCTHKNTCDPGPIIYNQHADEGPFIGSSTCPYVEGIHGPTLLPVNVERTITLKGQNLHLYQDEEQNYECVLEAEGGAVVVDALVEANHSDSSVFFITCQSHQYSYSAAVAEYNAVISVRRRESFPVDSPPDLHVRLYNCSVGHGDCSRCRAADERYGCVWCEGERPGCVYQNTCTEHAQHSCPAPHIHLIEPRSGPVEGGTVLTVSGSNLGQRAEDIQHSVNVAGVPCSVLPSRYEVSSRIVCRTTASGSERSGQVSVEVRGGGLGLSEQHFHFQDPVVTDLSPPRGPVAGGTILSIRGQNLRTGRPNEASVLIGGIPCHISSEVQDELITCVTGASNRTGEHRVTVRFARAERHLQEAPYNYTPDPNITHAAPSKSFLSGGRIVRVFGQNLDVVQEPRMRVTLSPLEPFSEQRRRRKRKGEERDQRLTRLRRIIPETNCPPDVLCAVQKFEEHCVINSSTLMLCPTPEVGAAARYSTVAVDFLLDNLHFDFEPISGGGFSYVPNPVLHPLNQRDSSKPYRYKPGSIISVEGENLDLAMFKEEVVARIGQGVCVVRTLTHNHLYCEPPSQQPTAKSAKPANQRQGMDTLPEFTVWMGRLNFSLGQVQYDSQPLSTFPLEAKVGVGVGASILALMVLVIVLMYRRKSKQALRDYKKVQIQLENLETSVRDRCKKEFTDLMTEMMDMSSELVGSGMPFLDYHTYAERIFFPGQQDSPLRRELEVPASRRATVEQGLVQLSNLLNSKLFLIKFIHTLEGQRTFSPRDRAYVASLLTVALHGKLEYFTDILKTLLGHLVEQYTAKNPKLMLRRTESVVEKLLTNWMSICLYSFLRDSAGEALYMLFRAIKHQVDKGPVDAVTGKAKYTLNDSRLLREDVEYRTLTLNVLVDGTSINEAQVVPTKVLDCDTITQVKEKILEHTWKGISFSQRPQTDSLHLEWRAGTAGHLILSDEDLTSVVQGSWKRLNTLQHYKVPDGATVTLVPHQSKQNHHDSHDYALGEKTPMLLEEEEGGLRLWHLVKASEEADLPRHRQGSLRERERERAKAIPEIYLTRLLSVKGTLQKFVDDLFQVILSTSRPVPLAVKYFFDLLDDQARQHNITDSDTIHIWKTNSLPLRFWINILKNPQFVFDVQASDNVDAVLSVIAQTFMDSCTIAEHKLGRDSPINKLLYARDIPRYKQMVERYYSDIRQTISASDQEMNSALAELSRNFSNKMNCLVASHELYKYINKYYDQIISSLEEDSVAQKMQLGCRLQQIAAALENKVTDL